MNQKRRSSIDLGTNTCLLLVLEQEDTIVQDFARVVRLGQGVDRTQRLAPEAVERTLQCLKAYAGELAKLGCSPHDTIAAATSQARDAKNGTEFFAQVERETGFRFRVLTGEQEAQASFQGALLPGMEPHRTAVIDIGGGSTEFMTLSGARLVGNSLDLGSVRFTERYLKSDPVTDREFWACEAAIDAMLTPQRVWRGALPKDVQLVGVAGTVTSIGAWVLGLNEYSREKLDACVLTRGVVHRLVEELKWRTYAEREAMTGIERGRADVLLAGSMILWRAMEILDFETCRVSTRGLRFGLLASAL